MYLSTGLESTNKGLFGWTFEPISSKYVQCKGGYYILLTLEILKSCLLKRRVKICILCIWSLFLTVDGSNPQIFCHFNQLWKQQLFNRRRSGNVTKKYARIFCGRMQQNCQQHSREKLSECPGHQHTKFVAFVCEWWTWYYCKSCWLNFVIGVFFFRFLSWLVWQWY